MRRGCSTSEFFQASGCSRDAIGIRTRGLLLLGFPQNTDLQH